MDRSKEYLKAAEWALANEFMNKKQKSFSKRRLERHILALCLLVKDMCPDAEIEIHVPGFGGLDAWLDVIVDDDKVLEIDEALSRRAFEIYMEEDYDIGMNVVERSVVDAPGVEA